MSASGLWLLAGLQFSAVPFLSSARPPGRGRHRSPWPSSGRSAAEALALAQHTVWQKTAGMQVRIGESGLQHPRSLVPGESSLLHGGSRGNPGKKTLQGNDSCSAKRNLSVGRPSRPKPAPGKASRRDSGVLAALVHVIVLLPTIHPCPCSSLRIRDYIPVLSNVRLQSP